MRRMLLVIVILVFSAGLAIDTVAQDDHAAGRRPAMERQERGFPGGQGMRGGGERMREGMKGSMGLEGMLGRLIASPRVAQELGLTEEQLQTLNDKLHAVKLEDIDKRAELEKAALEQARLMTAPTVDEEALMAAVEKTGQIRTELAKLRVRPLLIIKSTLTPEQMEKAREFVGQRMQRMREWGGPEGEEGQAEGPGLRRRPARDGEEDAPQGAGRGRWRQPREHGAGAGIREWREKRGRGGPDDPAPKDVGIVDEGKQGG